jgi:hypothetical protein
MEVAGRRTCTENGGEWHSSSNAYTLLISLRFRPWRESKDRSKYRRSGRRTTAMNTTARDIRQERNQNERIGTRAPVTAFLIFILKLVQGHSFLHVTYNAHLSFHPLALLISTAIALPLTPSTLVTSTSNTIIIHALSRRLHM